VVDRVEMARVLMERNQYKERFMELQEAVRYIFQDLHLSRQFVASFQFQDIYKKQCLDRIRGSINLNIRFASRYRTGDQIITDPFCSGSYLTIFQNGINQIFFYFLIILNSFAEIFPTLMKY
jgi:hypothetical protein